MKNTGIVRKVDELGRVVLPVETRRILGIKIRDPLEIFVDEAAAMIMLAPYRPGCFFCGSVEALSEFRGKKICRTCINDAR